MQKYCNHCMSNIEESTNVCSVCGHSIDNLVPAHHLFPGTLLNNKFYVGEALGEGGFGITYIGRDINLDIKVAIKEYYPNGYVNRSNTISPQVNNSVTEGRKDFFTKGRERFLNEARILAKFSGEAGIVDVRDFFEENNTAYIVMEFLDGKDLKNYLKENGTLTAEQTINLLMPVMNSLKKVHSQNLIHRDISPDNIMLVGNKVKLLDFGAARSVAAAENKSLSVMLKPGYAPEEQYRSKGNQGPWTDVYALCATMYKCITGITPDDATQRVFSDEVKTPTALGMKISSEIENAIMRGMSVHQKDRYQNIDDLIRGLQGIEVEYEGKDTPTIATNKKVKEDDIATRYEDNEIELVTKYGAPIEGHEVKEDDIETRYEGENKQFDISDTNEELKKSETNNDSGSAEVDVVNIDNKKIDFLNEDYSDIYSSSKVDECNDNQENVQPEYFYDSEETKQEKIKDILDNVIQENEQKVKKEFKSKRIIAAIIIAIIAILAIVIIVLAILSSGPKNKIDPTTDGFIFSDNESFSLQEPDVNLTPEEVYSSIKYNEKMFFGSYTLVPDESHDDELIEYQEMISYSDLVYNEDDYYLTNIPYKIVAGPENMVYETISQIEDHYNWMKLYYYSEYGYSYSIEAAYEIIDNKLVVTPVVSYEVGKDYEFYDLAPKSVEYDFEFFGPYLTLTYNSESVTLLADGFGKEIVDNSYTDYYSLYVNNMVSADSSTIDNIHTIRFSFNNSYNNFHLANSAGDAFDDAVGRMTEDGLFTFSYSDGHEKNTTYYTHQFVYFYCGSDGLILTDGNNEYYYQRAYSYNSEQDSGEVGNGEVKQFSYNEVQANFNAAEVVIGNWSYTTYEKFDEEIHNCTGFTFSFEIDTSDMESEKLYGSWQIYTRTLDGQWKQIHEFDCVPETTIYSVVTEQPFEPFDAFIFVREHEGGRIPHYWYELYDFVIE